MLTDEEELELVDNLTGVTYSYETASWNIEPTIGWERVDFNVPTVQVDFFPVDAIKYRFIGDYIGDTTNEYPQYGLCELERVEIRVYPPRYHSGYHGRQIGRKWVDAVEQHVLKEWPTLLRPMEAAIDKSTPIRKVRTTLFDKASNRYAYELSFNLRTTSRWTPDPGTGEKPDTPVSGFEFSVQADSEDRDEVYGVEL